MKFLAKFENLVNVVKSSACKLQILRSYLSGYPAPIIENLSVSDKNYFVALDLLRSEFQDFDFIKSQIFAEILSHELKAEFDLDTLRTFCTQVKANLGELKSSYGLDFMARETPGEELVSHIVFNKLPGFFKREMIRLSGSNYPSISSLIENVCNVIRSLECTRNKPVYRPKPTVCKANLLKRGKSSYITQAVVLCNSPFCKIKLIFYSPFQEAHVFYFPSSNFALHILILRHGNFNTIPLFAEMKIAYKI